MKTIFVCVFSVVSCYAFGQAKEFGWLVGTWKMKDKNVFERWTLSTDKKFLVGSSFKKEGESTVILEETSIMRSGDSFYYVADVAGDQDSVQFRISSFDVTSFVAENPEHDFPKIIRYKAIQKEGKTYLDAAIEGNGKVIPYSFEKVR